MARARARALILLWFCMSFIGRLPKRRKKKKKKSAKIFIRVFSACQKGFIAKRLLTCRKNHEYQTAPFLLSFLFFGSRSGIIRDSFKMPGLSLNALGARGQGRP
jgi:hypothetical protein